MKKFIAPVLLFTLLPLSLSQAGAAAQRAPALVTIAVDLDVPAVNTKYGKVGGFVPWVAEVHVGDRVRFINVDDEAHTATSVGIADDKPHGDRLSAAWSSGRLASEATSRTFLADKAGVYRYRCMIHAAQGQRGVIVVR